MAVPFPTTYYVGIGTAISNTGTATELSGGSYARIACGFSGSAASGLTQTLGAWVVATAPTPAVASAYGLIFDSSTGGNLVAYFNWNQPYTGSLTAFPSSTINIQFNTYVSSALAFSLAGGHSSSGSTVDAGSQIGTANGNPLIAGVKLGIMGGALVPQSFTNVTGQQSFPANVSVLLQGTGMFVATPAVAITAGTTRTQAGATALTQQMNRVDTSTAVTAGTNAADGVALPAAVAGMNISVINNTANAIKVYGTSADTINGMTSTIGVLLHPYATGEFNAAATGGWLASGVSPITVGYTVMTDTAAATLTAAGITSGTQMAVVNMSGNLGAGRTLTLPTVAATVAAMHMPIVGVSWILRIMMTGTGSFAWTVTTATGWTLTAGGTMTITGPNAYQDYLVNLSSLSAGTLQHIAGNLTTAFLI